MPERTKMKSRFHLRILWPFMLVFVFSLAAFVLLVPFVQNTLSAKAETSGTQVSYMPPLFALVFLILAVGAPDRSADKYPLHQPTSQCFGGSD